MEFCFRNPTLIEMEMKDAFVANVGVGITKTQDLLSGLAKALRFPEYFGNNWNALSDCLRDLNWIADERVVILHRELPRISEPDLFEYLDVLQYCMHDWERDDAHELWICFPEEVRDAISNIVRRGRQ